MRDAFDFSDVSDHHLTGRHSIANAGEVGYFKDECKCHPIVEFVGLRPKMYSFTVMDAEEYDPRLPVELVQLRHKAVAKGVSRANPDEQPQRALPKTNMSRCSVRVMREKSQIAESARNFIR